MTVLAAAGAIVGFLLLSDWWTVGHGGWWLAVAGCVASGELLLLRRWLRENHADRPQVDSPARLRPSLGIANAVTVFRGLLIAAVAGFLPLASPSTPGLWVPAVLYGTAVVLDFLDGSIARRFGQETRLGRRLDEATDTVGLFVAPTLAILFGQVPAWFLVVPLGKPAYLVSLWIYRLAGNELRPLPDSAIRRPIAGLQMTVTALVLVPVVSPAVGTVVAVVAVVPFVVSFGRDWLVVVGLLGE